MARRKSRAKPPTRKPLPKLDTAFPCLFCHSKSGVECTIDKKSRVGRLSCFTCLVSFATRTTYLTEPIDIYSEWLDACEEVNVDDKKPDARVHVQSVGENPVRILDGIKSESVEDYEWGDLDFL